MQRSGRMGARLARHYSAFSPFFNAIPYVVLWITGTGVGAGIAACKKHWDQEEAWKEDYGCRVKHKMLYQGKAPRQYWDMDVWDNPSDPDYIEPEN